MRKNVMAFALILLLVLGGCSSDSKGPTYSNPFTAKETSLRVMVANPEAYVSETEKIFVIGPLYVESNDLERKALTVRPFTDTQEIDMDVEIEVFYVGLADASNFIKTTKDDVIYAQGYMRKYSMSTSYYFDANLIRYAKEK